MPVADTPEIHNLKDFMSLLGQYDSAELGEDGGFILSIFGTKKKGKVYVADFNMYVDRFSGYNPHKDHHLLYWLQEEAGDLLRQGKSYVVAACVPDTLEPVAHTLIQIPKEEENSVPARLSPARQEEEEGLRGVYKAMQTAILKQMTSNFEHALIPPQPQQYQVGTAPVAVVEDEEEEEDMSEQYIELPDGSLLPQKKALERLLRQQLEGKESDQEKGNSMGLPAIMGLLTTLGPQITPLLKGFMKNLIQQPQPMPTVGGAPGYGYAPNGVASHPPQGQYPQGQYPPTPTQPGMPLQQQIPQPPPPPAQQGAPVNPLAGLDLGAIGAQLGVPGIENILSQFLGSGSIPTAPNSSFAPPKAAVPQSSVKTPMTSVPNIPGMLADEDDEAGTDEYEDVDYEEYEEEEEDMLGAEGKQLAKALYNVIYPIFRKKGETDPIGALKDIQTQGTEVFKEKGTELFTPDILEDWCAEAAGAVQNGTESESARAIFDCLPFVNKAKLKLAGSAAVTTILSTMANILAGLDGEFTDDELIM